MKKGFLFLSTGILALALAGCGDKETGNGVSGTGEGYVYEEDGAGSILGDDFADMGSGSNIEDAKDNFTLANYVENLYADDLNGKQIAMEYYMYADDNGTVVDGDYYRKDILRIGKTQDANGVLTYDFEATKYDQSVPKMTNVTSYKMSYDGTTFTATHPSLPGFDFGNSEDIDLDTAREYFENYSFKDSTDVRFVDILTGYIDYFNIPVEEVKETTNGYTGIHKGQFEFTGGSSEGGIGNMTFLVSLDKEYNFTGVKSVMSYDGNILSEMTIEVTDFK